MSEWVAKWSEVNHPLGNAGGSWLPMSFVQARDTLSDILERNLDRWSGSDRAAYERALTDLQAASEPSGRGFTITLPRHVLTLTREA